DLRIRKRAHRGAAGPRRRAARLPGHAPQARALWPLQGLPGAPTVATGIPPMPSIAFQLRTRITISLITILAAPAARADRRDFVRAYQYATQPQGNLEVEIWN